MNEITYLNVLTNMIELKILIVIITINETLFQKVLCGRIELSCRIVTESLNETVLVNMYYMF